MIVISLGIMASVITDYFQNEINLKEMFANLGIDSLVIIFWWKLAPKVEKWAEDDYI